MMHRFGQNLFEESTENKLNTDFHTDIDTLNFLKNFNLNQANSAIILVKSNS